MDLSNQAMLYDASALSTKHILVVGAGTVGSHVVMQLVKAGVRPERIRVYDNDVVEMKNLPAQVYSVRDVGLKKVYALNRIVRELTGYNLWYLDERRTINNHSDSGFAYIVSAADNMETRKGLFHSCKNHLNNYDSPGYRLNNYDPPSFFDARISGSSFECYAVTGKREAELYETTLFSDDEAPEPRCGYKSLHTTGYMTGAILTSMIIASMNGTCKSWRVDGDMLTMQFQEYGLEEV